MLNTCVLMGRLGRDPELRQTQGGKPIVTFSIACDRDFKGADGQKETDWISCVAFGATAEFVGKYATKGRTLVVHGRLQNRKWTDQSGTEKQVSEIIVNNAYFGDSKRDEQTQGGYPPQAAGYQPNYQGGGQYGGQPGYSGGYGNGYQNPGGGYGGRQ